MSKKILVSPGYGAGWASWNTYPAGLGKFVAEYQPIIEFLEAAEDFDDLKRRQAILQDENSDIIKQFLADLQAHTGESDDEFSFYLGGARDLTVMEIDEGVPYRIEEYDGSEYVITQDSQDWW